jgi:hypothetical protein
MEFGGDGIWVHSPLTLSNNLVQHFCYLLKGQARSICRHNIIEVGEQVGYLVKEGYNALLQQTTLPAKSSMWRNIWNNDGLPKINIFCRILPMVIPLWGRI